MASGASALSAAQRGPRWRRSKPRSPPPPPPPAPAPAEPAACDDDCGSLTWLLSFRLDALVAAPVEAAPEAQEAQTAREPAPARPDPPVGPPPPRKPPHTYPELIERALRERGELTVSAIYQWISERFPYYKANDERWKNSVRHNLSINPHFRKGARAPHGAGHLWSLAANAVDLLPVRDYSREPQPPDFSSRQYPRVIVLDEAAIAAASILPEADYICEADTAFLNPVSSEQVVLESGLTFPYTQTY